MRARQGRLGQGMGASERASEGGDSGGGAGGQELSGARVKGAHIKRATSTVRKSYPGNCFVQPGDYR